MCCGVSALELEEAQPHVPITTAASASRTPFRMGGDGTRRGLAKLAAVDRWAPFDCYGTLIDWNGGIRGQLARVFGEEQADELLVRYHELEPELEADGKLSYREVLTEAMRRLGAPAGEEDALAQSLPSWQPF